MARSRRRSISRSIDRSVGVGKIITEAPVSDGTYADEIMNFSRTDRGFLESGVKLMPLIPSEWSSGSLSSAISSGTQPAALLSGVLAMKYMEMDGVSPELLFLTNDGVFRFNPGLRGDGTSNPGLEEQYHYPDTEAIGIVTDSVKPGGYVRFPPQMEAIGNRIYFTFSDGGSAWVWDGSRVRPFGFSRRPGPIDIEGPARGGGDDNNAPNGAGFSVHGRIGTMVSTLADEAGTVVGGVDDGRWRYKVVFENPDGAFSSSSYVGGEASIRLTLGTPLDEENPTVPEQLQRRFLLRNIGTGSTEVVARHILRTRNLQRLPVGDFGDFFIIHRIPNNSATEWIDDTPDGELTERWEERRSVELFYFMKFFSGSLFRMRSDGNPSRVWWSEQTGMFGPIPESSMENHWQDVYPNTGPITGGIIAPYTSANVGSVLLIFKENATHYVSGDYPSWAFGTLHASAGCAGPNLSQAVPDGSAIWYGSGTFWRYTPDGKIVDIGGPIRKKLRRINRPMARMGSSWVDRTHGEVVFVLPVEDDALPKMQFVFDYQVGGWRRKNFISVRCAEVLGVSGMVAVGGGQDNASDSVYVLDRGYKGYSASQPRAEYSTGWCFYDDFGPNMHSVTRTADLVLTMEERNQAGVLEGTGGTVTTYTEWDGDNPITSETIGSSHPEDSSTPYYDSVSTLSASIVSTSETLSDIAANYGANDYRDRRTFSQRIATDIPSSSVFKVSVITYDSLALANIDAYGSRLADAPTRTPTTDVED